MIYRTNYYNVLGTTEDISKPFIELKSPTSLTTAAKIKQYQISVLPKNKLLNAAAVLLEKIVLENSMYSGTAKQDKKILVIGDNHICRTRLDTFNNSFKHAEQDTFEIFLVVLQP